MFTFQKGYCLVRTKRAIWLNSGHNVELLPHYHIILSQTDIHGMGRIAGWHGLSQHSNGSLINKSYRDQINGVFNCSLMKQTIQLVFSHLSHPVLFHSGWPVGPPCDRGGTKDREGGGQDRGLEYGGVLNTACLLILHSCSFNTAYLLILHCVR